jgi:hypothetical protein
MPEMLVQTALAEKYYNIYGEATINDTEKFFANFSENIIEDGKSCMVFLRLTDETFKKILIKPESLLGMDFLRMCLSEKGNNIHIVKAFGEGYSSFRNMADILINRYNPETFTWFRNNFRQLHKISTRRR